MVQVRHPRTERPIAMPKPSNRRQLETDLQDAQAELAMAHARLNDALASSESLAARVRELEAEPEARPPDDEADVGPSEPAGGEGSRASQLARRVAELEAARVAGGDLDRDAEAAATRARELAERVQSLELQLDAARTREDELTARAVHADGLLSDLGLRLADLGAAADRAEQLAVDLDQAREDAALAIGVARDEAAAAREELGEVRRDLGAALEETQARLTASDAARDAALQRSEAAEARAEEGETRASSLERELASATQILENLDQVYAAVRDRVDGTSEGLPAGDRDHLGLEPAAVTAAHAELQGQLETAIARVQGLEQELQESVEVLREQVRDLTERVGSGGAVVGSATAAAATGPEVIDPTAELPPDTGFVPGAYVVEDPPFEPTSPPAAASVQYLSVTDLLAIGERELGLGTPVDLAALEAVAALPCALDDEHERFPGVHVKAAAMLAETLRRQPFAHGNDRVALTTVVVFLSLNGYDIDAPEEDLAELTRIVAEGELPLLHIAAALEAASTPSHPGNDELQAEG